jgi:hypothetical protein
MSAASQTILQKFKSIETNANRAYMTLLLQCLGQVKRDEDLEEDDRSEKDKEQCVALHAAYNRWYNEIQENPRTTAAIESLYAAIGENHELLKARDEQLWTKDGDFLSKVFDEPGIDTQYLYDLLPDGIDAAEGQEAEEDGKSNLWGALMGLYRLSILIVIYLKNTVVSEIINLILAGSPDLNQTNVFGEICKQFKGKRKLRKLIMKLLKSKEDCFSDIFDSLQKVIGTLGDDVSLDKGMKANMEAAKKRLNEMFDTLLADQKVTIEKDEDKARLLSALEDKDQDTISALVSDKVLTETEAAGVQEAFAARGLDKMNMNKMVKGLGSKMESMMSAINSGSEEEMQKVLEGSGSNLDFESLGIDMKKFQAEMESEEGDDPEAVHPPMPDLD